MIEEFSKMLKKPQLYEKTDFAFWEDEYISKQMLENHLNPHIDGASRNLNFIKSSVLWIKDTIPPIENTSLLDIGCGPGIYAELLVKAGYKVTGVDFSKRSIDYAEQSAKRQNLNVTYLYKNYMELELREKFNFIIMIYCDYGALSKKDRKLLVQKIYHLLKPGGKFLLDVFSIAKFNNIEEQQSWNYSDENGFWYSSPHLELNRVMKYSNSISLEQTFIITEKDIVTHNLWMTYFTKKSLIDEFLEVGFNLNNVFSDVKGSPYNENNSTIALLLEK